MMFAQQLLKLINRLIELTEQEMDLLIEMDLSAASRITQTKEPFVSLYQDCAQKISTDEEIREMLRSWSHFSELSEKIIALDNLNKVHETCLKRVERSQTRFITTIQEKILNVMQPVNNYNKRGYVTSKRMHYMKQGGGSMATLDQAL